MASFKPRISKPRVSATGLAAAVGAGLATALLALMPALKNPEVLTSGVPMAPTGVVAVLLVLVAPLPIMVATLGFGSLAGLVATLVGSLAVAIVDLRPDALAALHLDKLASGGLETLAFAMTFAIPSWLLARLAVATPPAPQRDQPPLVRPAERMLGLVLAVAVGFAVIGALLDIAIAVKGQALDTFIDQTIANLEPQLKAHVAQLPPGADVHKLAVRTVWTVTVTLAIARVLLLSFNLWLAARIAQTSGLLGIDWPDIPSSLRLPRPTAIVMAVSLGLSFAGGPVGVVGVIVSGALGTAYVLQGLAVVHALTRGTSYRLPLLIIVYLSLIWLVVFYGLLGLVDAAFAFRDRRTPRVKKNP